MEILNKIGMVITKRKIATLIFVVALVSFMYFTGGHLISGVLTAFFALVVYLMGAELYQEYKNLPKAKQTTAGKSAPKKATKKSNKKK